MLDEHNPYASMNNPPMESSYLEPPAPTSWPTVVGTISIVLGSLGILCYGCNGLMTLMQPMTASLVPPEQQVQQSGFMLAFGLVQYCSLALLGIWLLAAGISVCKRSAWSRGAMISWAFMRMLLCIVMGIISIIFLQDIVDSINQQMEASTPPGSPPMFEMTTGILLVFIVVSGVLTMIWPTFVLVWFSRARIKHETAAWKTFARETI